MDCSTLVLYDIIHLYRGSYCAVRRIIRVRCTYVMCIVHARTRTHTCVCDKSFGVGCNVYGGRIRIRWRRYVQERLYRAMTTQSILGRISVIHIYIYNTSLRRTLIFIFQRFNVSYWKLLLFYLYFFHQKSILCLFRTSSSMCAYTRVYRYDVIHNTHTLIHKHMYDLQSGLSSLNRQAKVKKSTEFPTRVQLGRCSKSPCRVSPHVMTTTTTVRDGENISPALRWTLSSTGRRRMYMHTYCIIRIGMKREKTRSTELFFGIKNKSIKPYNFIEPH